MKEQSRFPTWAIWIIGVISLLAVSILVLSAVLGLRAGQMQVELQSRQQIGIALQQATDYQAEGNLVEAAKAYQSVLMLDPDNAIAQQGLTNLLAIAQQGLGQPVGAPATASAVIGAATPAEAATVPATQAEAAVATPLPAATPTTVAAAGAGPAPTILDGYWAEAQSAFKAGRWQEALTSLKLVQQNDPAYRAVELKKQLFRVYINLAGEKDNADNLEEALRYYDEALKLDPTATDIDQERELIANYLDVLTYFDVDWEQSIALLETIYAVEPLYRDVEERLLEAYTRYAGQLINDEQWCDASEQYNAALSVAADVELQQRQVAAQSQCTKFGNVAFTGTPGARTPVTGTATAALPGVETPVAGSQDSMVSGDGPAIGRILYSAVDPLTGIGSIFAQAVGRTTAPVLLVAEAAQPALRSDGGRLVFHNLRTDMGGISSIDPATGFTLRFSAFAEDSRPSWNPAGSRVVFSSNREGDRLWRIYVIWAEADGGTENLGLGDSPDWHPAADLIAYRGCDPSGNSCGIWTMQGSGSGRAPLTNESSDDRPSWSPDGAFVAFMSSGRHGNPEIYTVNTTSGAVTRLTENSSIDALPAVSPDGEWVAFVSNRDGGWKIYAVPSSGGSAVPIAPVSGIVDWVKHGMQWTY